MFVFHVCVSMFLVWNACVGGDVRREQTRPVHGEHGVRGVRWRRRGGRGSDMGRAQGMRRRVGASTQVSLFFIFCVGGVDRNP